MKTTWRTRLLDRVNPILVREVQQALNSRGFVVVLGIALVSVILVALTVPPGGENPAAGREAFLAALYALMPIVLFVVPFQAFLSTRHEVSGGTAEHLLLTNLTPGAIVRGKLLAALVQFMLYISLFAPLTALTFLLRGVDVPSIVLILALTFLASLAATALSIALGAGSAQRTFRALPYGLATLVLGGFTLAVLGSLAVIYGDLGAAVRRDQVWTVVGTAAGPALALTLLCGMGAASFLTHPHENRTTPFRVFAFVAVFFAYGWIWLVADGPRTWADDAGPGMALALAAFLGFFWLFAVTEEERLSPRVATLVPKNPLLAFLVTPFLPGGGRGLLFSVLLTVLVVACAWLFPHLAQGVAPDAEMFRVAVLLWAYVLFYAALGRLVRGLLGRGPRRSWIARCVLPAFAGFACVAPLVFDLFFGPRRWRWHWGHLLNPLFVDEVWQNQARLPMVVAVILAATVVLLLLNLPALVAGVAEVQRASRERRRRAR